ncbi:SDR family NAD(P)-dependent oxidoreductase [Telmatobacter bradus]|uniref:SDR family NAD(P)-dependent oxidoreductase n=1 Tax=Telmatobacter bradus TaxID=474953 RepID=UPI003B43D4B0
MAQEAKTALVTGGAKRIGRVLALELARAGFDVAFTYLNSQNEAEETAAAITALGRRSLALHCDVRSEDSVRSTLISVRDDFGRLDLLVNNAAVYQTAKLDELSLEAWDEVFATNARGPFLVSREALPLLRSASGRIVNIGSLGGMRPWATHAHYCAAKAALHMLTQAMAKGFAPAVSVNCVAPGFVSPGFVSMDEREASLLEHFAQKTPMRRNAQPEEIAAAVLFFATGPAFITGQILAVDGGLSLG